MRNILIYFFNKKLIYDIHMSVLEKKKKKERTNMYRFFEDGESDACEINIRLISSSFPGGCIVTFISLVYI